MLCEGKLWSLALESESRCVNPPSHTSVTTLSSPPHTQIPIHFPPEQPANMLRSPCQQSSSHSSSSTPARGCQSQRGLDIPRHGDAAEAEAFLVPSSCHSICQHYSDLHIAGGQVLPFSSNADDEGNNVQDPQPGPIILSEDVPSPSLLPQIIHEHRNSRRWKDEGGRERPSLLQFNHPLSNSQLNSYLEQKLLELYREYLTEGAATTRPVMASELLQTSLDQMTLVLSREQNMETTRAKDMLLSCLLKVTSSYQSSEISTPMLQISSDTNDRDII